jgi:hypothetical protein
MKEANYWPGTNIVKSTNNAFTWWMKEGDSIMTKDRTHIRSANGTRSRRTNDPLPINMRIFKVKK